MKLELLLRKAAPFLLIALLIACLLNMPQKEGMKGFSFFKKPKLQPEEEEEEEELSKVQRINRQTLGKDGPAADKFMKGNDFEEEKYSPDAWDKFKSLPERYSLDVVEDQIMKGEDYSPDALDKFRSLPRRARVVRFEDPFFERPTEDDKMNPVARKVMVMDHTPEDISSKAAMYGDYLKYADDVKYVDDVDVD